MIPIQYQSSPILSQFVDFIYQNYDFQATIDDFYDKVVNLDTAQGFGLDVWGRIVGVERYLTIQGTGVNFGFYTGDGSFTPFNEARLQMVIRQRRHTDWQMMHTVSSSWSRQCQTSADRTRQR